MNRIRGSRKTSTRPQPQRQRSTAAVNHRASSLSSLSVSSNYHGPSASFVSHSSTQRGISYNRPSVKTTSASSTATRRSLSVSSPSVDLANHRLFSSNPSDDAIPIASPMPPSSQRAPITSALPVDRSVKNNTAGTNALPMHPRANNYRQRVTELVVTGKGRELEAYLSSDPKAVIESGINNPDHVGSTLLSTAAKKHFFSTAIALVKFGADPNLCSKTGPPLFHSISTMDLAITKLLLKHGANPDYQNSKGQSALMIAATLPSVAFALQLIEGGCQKDLTDNDGRTALMYAARSGTPQMVEVLRDRGVNVTLRDNNDKGAAEYSHDRADGRSEEIIQILREPPRPRSSRRGFDYGKFQDPQGEIKLEF